MGLAPSCPEVIMYLLNTHLGKEMDTFIFSQEKHIGSSLIHVGKARSSLPAIR
jgi:hypothetical protein